MLKTTTLTEIANNNNTGVEYEIALFYKLLQDPNEVDLVKHAIDLRSDAEKVLNITNKIDSKHILNALKSSNYTLLDCSFETQNDDIGPSDVILYIQDNSGVKSQLGLSIKYSNQCTKNCTGMYFITQQQRSALEIELPIYISKYIEEMDKEYGNAHKWFRERKPSTTTDAYIDLIRDAVIKNWENITNKEVLFNSLFQADSPIDYWVCEFKPNGRYILITQPIKVTKNDIHYISIAKYETSYIGFYLHGKMIAKMQVKFNNGILENIYDRKGKRKVAHADCIHDGIEMIYGKPFGSWNFSVIR